MSEQRLQWEAVAAEELAQISKRHAGEAPVDEHLVGVAFSGGGIRSATFGLGVLERLKDLDLLKYVDYLSTVSGGGYIGAWLSANCKRTADRPAEVDWIDPRANWLKSIGHLRRYSNYLSPKVGFFSADTWSMGAIWIRNTLLVQLTVVLGIAAALVVPRLLVQGFLQWPQTGDWRWTSMALFVLAIAGIARNQKRLGSDRSARLLQSRSWKAALVRTLACLGLAVAIAMYQHFAPFEIKPAQPITAFFVSLFLLLAGFFAQPVAVMALSPRAPGKDPPAEFNYSQNAVQGLIVVQLMAVGYFVSAVLWGQSTDTAHPLSSIATFGGFFMNAWQYWQLPLSAAFASLWILSYVAVRRSKGLGILVAFLAPWPVLLVLHALLSGIMVLLHTWAGDPDAGKWRAFVWAPPLVLYSFALTVNILIGMLGRQSSESVREWWSRLGAWLGIYGVAWMVITIAGIYGPLWAIALLDSQQHWTLSAVGTWLATTVAGLLAGKSGATGGRSDGDGAKEKTMMQQVLGIVALIGPFVFIAGLLVGVSTALYFVILNISVPAFPTISDLHSGYWLQLNRSNHMTEFWTLGGLLAAVALLAGRVDINEFSLNAFYRSRLSRCYLGAARYRAGERNPQAFTGLDEADDLKMAELGGTTLRPPAGPLHIVNCALNLGGSSDLALHTRHSASFTITPYVTGSSYQSSAQADKEEPPVGYIRTATYGGDLGQPTLGQAISVSGAAASPNMGFHTSSVVAFLLTMFNVRLGWWFPNPIQPATASTSPTPVFSLRYLLKELFGGADDMSNFLMISDGGHFENLAAYELIRRKCRVIIISDAECDTELHFEGLGTLIRMCEVDFQAKITIDVDAIRRRGDAPWSARSVAIGRIVYGGGTPDGVLIYLKASMTGGEDSSVLQYKSSHPTFPHESTGDQFYGEDQFESYRHLGREIAGRALGTEPPHGPRTFEALAMGLLEPDS